MMNTAQHEYAVECGIGERQRGRVALHELKIAPMQTPRGLKHGGRNIDAHAAIYAVFEEFKRLAAAATDFRHRTKARRGNGIPQFLVQVLRIFLRVGIADIRDISLGDALVMLALDFGIVGTELLCEERNSVRRDL